MPTDYLQVSEEEGETPIELPTEDDGTLLLSTLLAQYPAATGLRFKNPKTKAFRGVKLSDGKFYPPQDEDLETQVFFCTFPKENKRKGDDSLEKTATKSKRLEPRSRTEDLIIFGLPWKTTDEDLKNYFETFGETLMAQVYKDPKTDQSKGYGFVRFASYEAQMRVLGKRHMIGDRWCDVKFRNTREGQAQRVPTKVFIGRLTEDISPEDMKEYFGKFGEVTDVYIPKPFRKFAFVTFLDPEVAQSLCGEDHIVKGTSLHVTNANPKHDPNKPHDNNSGGYNRRFNYQYGDNQGRSNQDVWGNQRDQRGNNDLPNMQGLGIAGQGPSSNSSGMNLPTLSPALLAAALNQAGLGSLLGLGNIKSQLEPNFNSSQNGGSRGNQMGGNYGGGNQSSGPRNTRDGPWSNTQQNRRGYYDYE